MKVAKFGGTSLANAEQIRKVANIVLADPDREIIIVSAPGKRFKEDIKVTDLLIACAEAVLGGKDGKKELDAVVARYSEIAKELGVSHDTVDTITEDLQKRMSADTSNSGRFMDSLKAAGEDNCAKLFAAYLKSTGHNASYIDPKEAGLLLSNEYGNAQVLPQSYDNLKKLRNIPGIKIFPGFFGYSPEGNVVTFSRGGSDISGSILAAAVDADVYENFTDVDSVFAVNPNIVPNPQPIEELTYREMRELSYAGFSVFHEEALVPVFRKGIPVNIKNTNNPSAPGTKIVPKLDRITRHVVGIASDRGFCSINTSKYLMNREVGFGRRLLGILADEGVSFEHIPSGIDNMSVILRERQLPKELEERVLCRIKEELQVDDISIRHNLALVMVVGEGMQRTVGMAARATGALARAGINLEMINQGASEFSMMFGVNAEDSDKAVKALYKEFFE